MTDRFSSLHDINALLTQIADASSYEFVRKQRWVISDLSLAVERLLQCEWPALPEDAARGFQLLSRPVVAERLDEAAEICGVAGATRFLRELEAALIGEQIVSAVCDKNAADLQALIPRMVAVLRGDPTPLRTEDMEFPRRRDDTPFEIADRCFASLAEHPRYASDSLALQQARGWIYRRLAALELLLPFSFGSPFALKAPIVRGSSANGEAGWLYVARVRDGQGGCIPEPQMLCYLRDEAFEEAICAAWAAAQAFVQNEANRRGFFASLSGREIRRRLETEQVRWRIEISGQRDYLRGDSLGAAAAVAFVSVLTNLHYDRRVLLTATTAAAGRFDRVGHIEAKIKAAKEQDIRKILVSRTQAGIEASDLLQTVGDIAEALEWTSRVSSGAERMGADSTEHEQESRQGMLRNINTICRKRNQFAALREKDRLVLNFQINPDMVVSPTNLILRRAGALEADILPGTLLNTFCRDEQDAILLLGSKGAGKSTLLWELAEDLVTSALNDPAHPVPIVFDLISWPGGPRLDKWLVEELVRPDGYAIGTKIGKKLAWSWVKNGKLLLLLDGLDEVEENRRAACVKAINTYRDEHQGVFCPLIVCCRTQEYGLLPRLHLNNAVIVQPLTPHQVDNHLLKFGDKLANLKRALVDNPILYEFFSAPLMLSLAVKVYSQRDGSAFTGSLSQEERESRLWDTYINLMIDQHKAENKASYAKEDALRWLEWLGYYLTRIEQNRFLIEEMQPAEILNGFQTFLVRWLFGILTYAAAAFLLFIMLFGRTALAMGLALPLLFIGHSRTVMMDRVSVYNPARLRNHWKRIPVGGIIGLFSGGIIGGIVIEIAGWTNHTANGLLLGIESGSISGIYVSLFMAIILTLFEDKTFVPSRPGSGIRHSFRMMTFNAPSGGILMRVFIFIVFMFLAFLGLLIMSGIEKSAGSGAMDVMGISIIFVILLIAIIGIGIQQGIRMACALVVLLIGLGASIYIVSATKVHISNTQGYTWLSALFIFFALAIYTGGQGGVRTVFQHYLLRWFLARSGRLPYQIKPFLDWADQRILVMRKGGGWEFFHIALKQRFAERHVKAVADAETIQTSV